MTSNLLFIPQFVFFRLVIGSLKNSWCVRARDGRRRTLIFQVFGRSKVFWRKVFSLKKTSRQHRRVDTIEFWHASFQVKVHCLSGDPRMSLYLLPLRSKTLENRWGFLELRFNLPSSFIFVNDSSLLKKSHRNDRSTITK